ncbi:MAG: hypothetical protein CM15mV96_070 [uncultured marine virus]|nr:MAG: hypothetical protein CM15mV96_070 [uncultured marine virus]
MYNVLTMDMGYKKFVENMSITEDTAESMLKDDLKQFEGDVLD